MMDPTALAAQTVERARTAMQSTRIASLPEVVKLLRALTGNSQQVSVVDLADVIRNDPLVTAKVIGAANMLAYNPNGVEVTSVTQAIHVIGFERIRTLAMSLMLAEQISRTHSPDAQREYAAQSLLAGCIAQALAAGRPMVDRNHAFICGSLRNFGQIVLTACMPDEFQELRKAAGGEPSDEGYRQAFGLTPLDLGYELLTAASLPEEILSSLRAIPPAVFAAMEDKPEDQFRGLTAFAGELAALTLDPRSDPVDFATNSRVLAQRYEHVLPLLHEEIHALMESTSAQMDQIVRTFRIKSLPVRVAARLVRCRNAVDPNRPPVPAAPVKEASRGSSAPVAGSAPTLNTAPLETAPPPAAAPAGLPAHDWDQSVRRLAGVLHQPGVSCAEVQATLLDIFRTGLGVQDCLLFNADPDSKKFPLVGGLGTIYRDLKSASSIAITVGERTVLGVCLARNENIIIHHAREEKILPYLPGWLRTSAGPNAFVLLPVSDGARVGGVLVAGWTEARQIVLPPDCVRAVRTMLAVTCRMGMRRPA